jgi:hypothetical protein
MYPALEMMQVRGTHRHVIDGFLSPEIPRNTNIYTNTHDAAR